MSWTLKTPEDLHKTFGGPSPSVEKAPSRLENVSPPWALFLGPDAASLARAASAWISERAKKEPSLEILLPPESPALPLALCDLRTPAHRTALRVVLVPRLDRAFFDTLRTNTSFSLTSSLYLLPKLARAAGGDEAVSLVATALGSELSVRAPEVLNGRGLAARFTLYRVARLQEASSPSPGRGRASNGREPRLEPEQLSREGFEALRKAESPPERFLELGLATREPKLREEAYRHAASLAPDSALTHLCLASALSEQNRTVEAIQELKLAIEKDPELDAAYYELGKALIRADDMDGAVAAFRRTTELLPEFASGWGNLGAALGEIEDVAGAEQAFIRAVKLDPFSHALHSNLGVTLRNQGRLDEAEAEFQRVLELASDFVFGYYNLAYNYYLQDRYGEAISTFEKAQSMDRSRSPRQALLLAIARLASGDAEGAIRDYRETFGRLEGPMRADMRRVAEWDLRQLSRTRGVSPAIKQTLELVRSLA
ncbi:MAG: tetratricopeptide repeat protein [Acidobacteriota bacterium]